MSNPVALKHLATIKKGDTVIVYHTGDEKQAVGLAVAVSDAYPDPKQNNPKRTVVDLAPERALPAPVALWLKHTEPAPKPPAAIVLVVAQ